MTEEELVEVAARAVATDRGCWRLQTCDPMLLICNCGNAARAVLAAVEPKIRADERERAARIADGYANEVREAGDRLAALGRSTTASEAKYDAGTTLAAAIRADNYGRNPPK